jgi:hypothetical protein
MEFAQSATKSSPTTAMLSQITKIQEAWEEPGEMTIRTISEQLIGGATEKKDQPEWMTDGRPISRTLSRAHVKSDHFELAVR